MMKNMRKELDEVNNAMKGKTAMNLNGLIKRTNSPFTASVLECPLPPKFRLPQLDAYDGTNPRSNRGIQDDIEPLVDPKRGDLQIFPNNPQGSNKGMV